MKRKPALTELGKAIRERDAYDASAWEFDYSEAIKAAFAFDASRLLNLLRGHKRPVTANALMTTSTNLRISLRRWRSGNVAGSATELCMRPRDWPMSSCIWANQLKKLKACGPIPTGSGCRMMNARVPSPSRVAKSSASMESVSTESRCAIY